MTMVIELYEDRLGPPSQRYRWRARGANGRKMANGGEGYNSVQGRADALNMLWPNQDHIEFRNV